MASTTTKLKNIFAAFRISEFCLGTVCFGLFAYYYILTDTSFHCDYNPCYPYDLHMNIVKNGIAFVAGDAFPFLVQIPFLVAYWKYGESFQYNILNPMVNFVGVIVYITSGSICLGHVFGDLAPYEAVGSMFIITGIVYLMDFGYWMVYLRKGPEHGLGNGPALHSQQMVYPNPAFASGQPMMQPYTINPNLQYGTPNVPQYAVDPNGQPYIINPNLQYVNPMVQPYMVYPNQQHGPLMTQPYIVNPNLQHSPPIAQPRIVNPTLQPVQTTDQSNNTDQINQNDKPM